MRGLLLLMMGALAAAEASASEPRFEAPPAGSYELPAIDRVSEHEMLGTDGQPAALLGLADGEAAIVSFVYLSCADACPLATATLMRLDRELAKSPELRARTRLVTASFDPERDGPAQMRSLREHVDPGSRWSFLTARDAAALAPVLADFGQDAVWVPAADGAPAPDRLRHVLKVFLVDAQRDVRNIYSTEYLDVRLVMNDLRTILESP
jgi:cytochrome oxidase Cu insertion factor (SCO1/SenC/PrrC family)